MAKHKSHQADGPDAPCADQPAGHTVEAGRAAEGAAAQQPAGEVPVQVSIGSGAAAGAAAPPSTDASTAVETEQQPDEAEQIAQLRAELAEMKDRALRYQAELDNYRKRAQRQIEDDRRYANLSLLRDLLPVFDNVHRAIDAAEKSPEPAGLLAGIKLVAQQLQDVFSRHDCVPIEALHLPFDPHWHEAVGQQPSEQHPANTVLLVTQAGFQLHDRVVRPSQVIVSTTNHAKQ